MRLLAITAILLLAPLVAWASDDLPYKTCEINGTGTFACSTREAMAGLVQTFARDDLYERQKLFDSKVCITLEASEVKELRKYDAVKMSIFYDDYVKKVPIAWVKVQTHVSSEMHDAFIPEQFLECK